MVPSDELPHAGMAQEEWVFTCWSPDARVGVVSGHRLLGRRAWYWAAVALADGSVLHVAEWDVRVRAADPFIVKAEQLWAEHTCDAPLAQWTIGNETYAAALDDADEALGRAYGDAVPIGFDLEWYAIGGVTLTAETGDGAGYEQRGVVHGVVEVVGRPTLEFVEAPARRWHRWSPGELGEPPLDVAVAHTGARAPFAFPDGRVVDLVLTQDGWRRRRVRRR